MELIKAGTNINFIGNRKIALVFSLALILITIASLVYKKGPNYGIDFAGGTQVIVKFSSETDIAALRGNVSQLNMGDVVVQKFGDIAGEYIIRVEKESGTKERASQLIKKRLKESYGEDAFEVIGVEMVGPQVGDDLKGKALKAMLFAMGGILIYISFRFEFRYAVGAVIALIHDIFITLGAFSVTNYEISLPVVAAFLAIIGYSLNDTIIVYDRIRDNLKKVKKGAEIECINKSINETLSRTLLTSLTTLAVVGILFIYGGGVIHNFAFALMIGVLIGTYSSIFVASPVLIYYNNLVLKQKVA